MEQNNKKSKNLKKHPLILNKSFDYNNDSIFMNFIPTLNSDEIYEKYKIFLFLLKDFCLTVKNNNNFEIKYIPLNLIKEGSTHENVFKWDILTTKEKNPFCHKYKDNKKLMGLDILNRGTYFPIYTYKTTTDEYYYVAHGFHRITGLKHALNLKELNNYKIFCITRINNNTNYDKCLFNDWIIPNNMVLKQDIKNQFIIKKKLKDYYILDLTDINMALEVLNGYAFGLQDYFTAFDFIEPFIKLNNEEEFNNWLNS